MTLGVGIYQDHNCCDQPLVEGVELVEKADKETLPPCGRNIRNNFSHLYTGACVNVYRMWESFVDILYAMSYRSIISLCYS